MTTTETPSNIAETYRQMTAKLADAALRVDEEATIAREFQPDDVTPAMYEAAAASTTILEGIAQAVTGAEAFDAELMREAVDALCQSVASQHEAS